MHNVYRRLSPQISSIAVSVNLCIAPWCFLERRSGWFIPFSSLTLVIPSWALSSELWALSPELCIWYSFDDDLTLNDFAGKWQEGNSLPVASIRQDTFPWDLHNNLLFPVIWNFLSYSHSCEEASLGIIGAIAKYSSVSCLLFWYYHAGWRDALKI